MTLSKIAGIEMYFPKNIFTNDDLKRRYDDRTKETTTTMDVEAAKITIERYGLTPQKNII